MTVTSLVLQSCRTQFADPTSLRLVVPMIASKDGGIPLVNHLQVDDVTAYLSLDDSPQAANLLPRSRTGCWTCRSRKVKCDEVRPVCSQCARLGHNCDYQPRLSFRNDTRRIVGRMSEVSTKGNAVWDPTSPTRRAKSRTPSAGEEDSLPPFSMLTSDEDREKKAEASSPGTYHVVVNPDSFSNLPEYADGAPAGLSVRRRKGRLAKGGGMRTERERPAITSNGTRTGTDPNVVILKRFEDATRRSPFNGRSSRLSPASDTTSNQSPAPTTSTSTSTTPHPCMTAEDSYFPAVIGQYETRSQDDSLMENFRNVVWRQLIPVEYAGSHSPGMERNNSLGAEVFEREAAHFLPLYHAIMALSALSLADQDTSQNINALQHYQQAFTSLQTSLHCNDDLTSDGLFLTHFLLLVYEIAAAERKGSNLWSHHISRLLHITIMRRATFGRERFPFIIWWVCNVDLYALISGAGSGEFVGAMINGNMLPGPESILYPTGTRTGDNEGVSVIYPEEQESLPTILQLSYDTFMAAASLGFLAAEARGEMIESAAFAGMEYAMMAFSPSEPWHQEVLALQHRLGALWESPEAVFLMRHRGSLPKRSREVLEQASTMFHVLQLYSFTSMWPGQRLQSGGALEQVVHHHAAAILQIAQGIVQADRFDRRFIIFPLFLAGASLGLNTPLKKRAMELLCVIEERGMGRNAATARLLLQLVVERQNGRLLSAGHTLDVDWFELMSQHGFQLVNFGL